MAAGNLRSLYVQYKVALAAGDTLTAVAKLRSIGSEQRDTDSTNSDLREGQCNCNNLIYGVVHFNVLIGINYRRGPGWMAMALHQTVPSFETADVGIAYVC